MAPWKIFNQKWILNSCQFSMVSWVILGKYVGRTKMISKIKVKFTTKKPFSSYISVALRKGPAGNYMFKVNNRNTRARYEICSTLKIKIPIVVECFYCWLWTYFTSCSSFSIDNFEQVNAGWERFTSNASKFRKWKISQNVTRRLIHKKDSHAPPSSYRNSVSFLK